MQVAAALLPPYRAPLAISRALELTLTPATHQRRVVETFDIRDSSIVRHVTLEISVPDKHPLLIPLLRAPRLGLLDNLRIDRTDSVRAFTLNRSEAQDIQAQMIEAAARGAAAAAGVSTRSSAAKSAISDLRRVPYDLPDANPQFLTLFAALGRGLEPRASPAEARSRRTTAATVSASKPSAASATSGQAPCI